MKRRLIFICIAVLLLAGVWTPAGVAADTDHPIVMTILCDPDPELETGGTIPDLLFTIRNNGAEDYTLDHAILTGGYEDRTLKLDEHITVLSGGTKEFHLTDVVVEDAQLDTTVIYRLSWKESELLIDSEDGTTTTIEHERETEAEIRIERFVPPELTISATASAELVRAGETFTVTYTISNETKYDMSGIRLYDPEQSMQSIGLPSAELFAGESRSVEVTYTMGKQDMTFSPVIEYTVRQREQMTRAETLLTVESVVVELVIEVEDHSATSDGSVFLVMVRNDGNRTVTDIQLYDEINTPIEEPFDLAPEQSKVLKYVVPSAISSETIRKIRFHVKAVDAFGTPFLVTDTNQYDAVPYVDADSVRLNLYAVLQRAYYDGNGKLCGTIQFEIRNYSSVKLRNAKLTELKLFGDLESYSEIRYGETFTVKSLQLDGIPELQFVVYAFDPAGKRTETETIRFDLSRLKELADQTDDPVYVYPNNPFFRDLDVKYRGILRIAGLVVLLIATICAIICIILYAIERSIKAKLPAEFEENMENAMQKTKRRSEPQIFGDVPTEQFGYTVPIKLRNYGELTEQEAEARRKEYEKKLNENLREYKASPAAISRKRPAEQTPESGDAAFSGTKIMPVARPATTPMREDIRLIAVNPIEPEPPEKTEKPAPKTSAKNPAKHGKHAKQRTEQNPPKHTKAKPAPEIPEIPIVRTADKPSDLHMNKPVENRPMPEPRQAVESQQIRVPRVMTANRLPDRRPLQRQPVKRMNG